MIVIYVNTYVLYKQLYDIYWFKYLYFYIFDYFWQRKERLHTIIVADFMYKLPLRTLNFIVNKNGLVL